MSEEEWLVLMRLLAEEAKKLTEGMQRRTGRNPDIADYQMCFVITLKHELERKNDETSAEQS